MEWWKMRHPMINAKSTFKGEDSFLFSSSYVKTQSCHLCFACPKLQCTQSRVKYWGEGIGYPLKYSWAFLVAQRVKQLPAMWETRFDPWVRKTLWRRKWQPTPVLLPGKSNGWGSLVGYSPWGHKESDMTKWLHFQ